MKKYKSLLSILLALIMLCSLAGRAVFAEGIEEEEAVYPEVSIDGVTVTVGSNGEVQIIRCPNLPYRHPAAFPEYKRH